ncbi:MAG TPA: ABC transporter family substrate-binding protein [Pseudonocardiaceae bacterium]|nr:ABC transporter family substrate-binding protein [Pseudonocardiaceae bacterium]
MSAHARRSRIAGAIAFAAGTAVALSACSAATNNGGPIGNAGPSNADPQALALSQPYSRPKVPDAGTVTVAVDEATTAYNNNLNATNNLANTYVDNLLQPSPFFTNDLKNITKVQVDGDLMDSVRVLSTDPQVIQYNIRKQAVWQDGAPVDCSDFYLQWLSGELDSGDIATMFNNVLVGLDHIGKVACSNGNKTVTVKFSQKWADWQGLFANLLPAHVLERATGVPDVTKLDDRNAADHTALLKVADFYAGGANNDHGFGNLNLAYDLAAGPFMLKSYDGKQDSQLVRNPKWWGNPAGPSTLDIRVNRDDESAFQQLQNKEIQVAAGQPNGQVAQQVRASGGQFKLITGAGVTFEHLDYNAKNADFTAHPELRKALSDCVNRQDVITKVVADVDPNTKPLGMVLFLPTEHGYTDDFANTGHGNENAAKQVLQQAGWTMGTGGYMQKNGQTATITIGHKTDERRSSTVQAIQAECKAAGIQIQDFTSDGFNGKNLPAGNFQVALFAWTGSPFKSGFTAIYHSPVGALGASNYMKYSDPKVDQLLPAADVELNYAARVQELQQADALIAADGFTLPLFALPEYAVTDGSVTATAQDGTKQDLQDNQASIGILWDSFTWQHS